MNSDELLFYQFIIPFEYRSMFFRWPCSKRKGGQGCAGSWHPTHVAIVGGFDKS
jgi:hypothetical protein